MSDYNFLIESRLSPKQFQVLGLVGRLAAEEGLNLYLVGGVVRDLTCGQPTIRDLNLAVEGSPQRILRRLVSRRHSKAAERGQKVPQPAYLRLDAKLGSANIEFTNGIRAELAMTRSEFYPRPGARPQIRPASIFEDLRRRDFSANAMAVSLHPNSRGLLLDPTNGAADIERRELRVLHSRSFLENPSRIYRLLRLADRLGFRPEGRTKLYVDAAIQNRLWEKVTPPDQGRELNAILREGNPGRSLKLLAGRGMVTGLDRKLARVRIPTDCLARVRAVARRVAGADPFLLNFHCLVEKLGRGERTRLARKIIAQRQTVNLALRLDRDASKLARVLKSSRAALPSEAYKLLSHQPRPLLLYLLAHDRRAKVQSRLRTFLFRAPQLRAKLPRAELRGLGVQPGPQFEKILHRVFPELLDGKIKSHPQMMKRLRALAGMKEPPKPAKPSKPAKPAKPAARPAVKRPAKKKAHH